MKNGNESVVIVSATRTAVGSFCGGLATIPAHDLGAVLIKKVAESANIDLSEIDEVILGQILTAGQGQNPARQAAMKAGVPEEKTAFLVNQLCGSGLRTVALGAQQLILGDANIVIAGGQESMSQSHHSAFLRLGKKMGSMHIEDTMLKDGLNDALFGYHMGVTAENISKKFKISRKKQDAFALNSQLKASKSQLNGKFIDEITPINIQSKKENKIFKNDEYIRTNINLQAIEKLQPAFDDLGTVTAPNSSGLNDGAAVVLLMREKDAIRRGLTPLARIASWATAGVDPKVMGTGPIPASKKATPSSSSLPQATRYASTLTPRSRDWRRCFAKDGHASVLGRKLRASDRITKNSTAACSRSPPGHSFLPVWMAPSSSMCLIARAETTRSPSGPRWALDSPQGKMAARR